MSCKARKWDGTIASPCCRPKELGVGRWYRPHLEGRHWTRRSRALPVVLFVACRTPSGHILPDGLVDA